MISEVLRGLTTTAVIEGLEIRKVPVGPVNTLEGALRSDQAAAREMTISMPAPQTGKGEVELLGNPLKFSRTPVSYRRAPPSLGADTKAVLNDLKEGD